MKTKQDLINYFQGQINNANEKAKECYLKQAEFLGLKTEYQKTALLKHYLDDGVFHKSIESIKNISDELIEDLLYEYKINHQTLLINKRTFFVLMIKALEALEKTNDFNRNDTELKNSKRTQKRLIANFKELHTYQALDAESTMKIPLTASEIASKLFMELRDYYDDEKPLEKTIKILFGNIKLKRIKKINFQLTKEELERYKQKNTLDLTDPTL